MGPARTLQHRMEAQVNRTEHLLTLASEECSEVQQNVSKTLRFGLDEIKADLTITNAERVCYEMRDLISIFKMLEAEGAIPDTWFPTDEEHETKRAKVEKYIAVSMELGTIGVLDNISVQRDVPSALHAGWCCDVYAAVMPSGRVEICEVDAKLREVSGRVWADMMAMEHFTEVAQMKEAA